MPDSDEATIQKAWKRWRDESGAVMNTMNDRVAVRKPTCPVLMVIGGKDTDISPETSRNVASWADADVHQYANMSHVGPLLSRRATEVADSILVWLKAHR
jgi:pimeloyl-ACP methyl ester carboxylesterase